MRTGSADCLDIALSFASRAGPQEDFLDVGGSKVANFWGFRGDHGAV